MIDSIQDECTMTFIIIAHSLLCNEVIISPIQKHS